jgi:hypothetical protein
VINGFAAAPEAEFHKTGVSISIKSFSK